ncbi:TetR/AcrR family transcriptional regulator C-terminal domain-containing protein [Actinoplanes sp. NPDC024001]|uniref:TetR/AcrR family transcriptional regulator C-terminal domain-containing protein n=1 Tax=Actinoplanes sp. NPDC024001 TaxID=3154598 RepID=UPI0034094094
MAPRSRTTPLSREAVLRAAVDVADERGIAAVSMRAVAERLGVEAMSLYHHVRNKDEILDGLVDLIFAEIELPAPGGDWRAAMRDRAASARAVLGRHIWAVSLMDSRPNAGAATLRHHNAVLGCLRAAGFDIAAAATAFSLIDSYVYGFVIQEAGLPFTNADELEVVAGGLLEQLPADEFPHLAEMVEYALRPGYAYADEFAIGLDLILDSLARRLL